MKRLLALALTIGVVWFVVGAGGASATRPTALAREHAPR